MTVTPESAREDRRILAEWREKHRTVRVQYHDPDCTFVLMHGCSPCDCEGYWVEEAA